MKVYISGDIEGTCFTTNWREADKDDILYPRAAKQMTAEVKAACEGALAAGADLVVVKDSHDGALNIDPNELPKGTELIRGWTGSPMAMVDGVDESFDAIMFVGYHSAAGREGNPLSHTFSTKTTEVTLNGKPCSEFMLYSYAAAMYGVPAVFLAGDKMLCDDSKKWCKGLTTVAVKEGMGGLTHCLQPEYACELIRMGAEKALSKDFSKNKIELPKTFKLVLKYKEHRDAVKYSFYPGFKLVDSHTIEMNTKNFIDVLTAVEFVF